MLYFSKQERGFFDSAIHAGLPIDAVQISHDEYEDLLLAQSSGKHLNWSGSRPVVVEPIASTTILQQIIDLESKVTHRRIREALLSGDHSFIESIEAQIAALRNQLT